jgi:hypothetical protein
MMHGRWKSDPLIVPVKPPNKAAFSAAEAVEGRGGAKGNAVLSSTHQTQSWASVSQATDRIRCAARRGKTIRLTALLHHVNVDLLRFAFHQLKRRAAPGIDGITWHEYEADLEANLADLHGRVQRGAYRAKPSRRQYIPKPDGRQRPLGIAALEDKIVQRAVVEVLNAIYETDFLGFSYGLPRLLLWLPAGARPAPCAGRARGWDLPAEDQLDPGCRYPGVLRQHEIGRANLPKRAVGERRSYPRAIPVQARINAGGCSTDRHRPFRCANKRGPPKLSGQKEAPRGPGRRFASYKTRITGKRAGWR